jgi:hypothetical protein
MVEIVAPRPTYDKVITKTARNIITSGAILRSNVFGQCKFAAPISELDWVGIDKGRKFIIFYGALKYEGLLNFTYTEHFGMALIRDHPDGGFGDINIPAYNYEEVNRPQ